LRLKEYEWRHSDCEDKPDIEVEQQISNIVVVWLGPEDVWSSVLAGKDIVED
jgi:hypothetical protein